MNAQCESFVKKYDILGKSIGCLPGEYVIEVDETITLVIYAPRSVPAAIREQVKEELDHLERCGIITKVMEPAELVSNMVVVKKKNNSEDLHQPIRLEQNNFCDNITQCQSLMMWLRA